jgi:hypothetical protein
MVTPSALGTEIHIFPLYPHMMDPAPLPSMKRIVRLVRIKINTVRKREKGGNMFFLIDLHCAYVKYAF